MSDENVTPQQAIASLANIAPFLWPFVLLSLGVALTPVSPISWSYSTWLLFIIPLSITIFAPIRAFSGPLRYAYLEYASKISSLAVSLLKAVMTNFHSVPTLALPALFFLPVLPILFFILFPALPMVWNFIAYHYRRRLKAVTTSAATTNTSLDLAIARARHAVTLAHTYEKQALYTISTTQSTPLLALPWHSTDFTGSTPVLNNDSEESLLAQRPNTLGADLAAKILDTEKRMNAIDDVSQQVRAMSEQAVAVATEGDMAAGEELVQNAAHLLEDIVKQVEELHSVADQSRFAWIDYRRRLNEVTSSASTTIAKLDHALTLARRASTLAHTHEEKALYTISTTRNNPLLALPWHSTDFSIPELDNSEGPQLVQRPGTLGGDLAAKVLDTEERMDAIEDISQRVRAKSEQAVAVAMEGDMVAGEEHAKNAASLLEDVVEQVEELRSVADQSRCMWIEYRRCLNEITSSTSATISKLDLVLALARRASTLAHTHEDKALYTISTTRSNPLLALPWHSTDFSMPEPDNSQGRRLVQKPGTLGGDLAAKVLDTEKRMDAIEDVSQQIRAKSEQAVTDAMEGDVAKGKENAKNAARLLEDLVKQVDELRSVADQSRCAWIEYRRCLNEITSSASATISKLDHALTLARRANTLAHTHEEQALSFVSTTRRTASQTLALHNVDFFDTSVPVKKARQLISNEAEGVRALGLSLTEKMLIVKAKITDVEDEAANIRTLLEESVTTAVDGDVATAKDMTVRATESLETVEESVQELCSTSDGVRQAWIELSVKHWAIL